MFELNIDNFGIIEKANVPLGGDGLTLIWGDNRDSTAVDSNGSGKSTIFRALTWCLFGKTTEGTDIIKHGSTTSQVCLICGSHTITRTAKRNKRSMSMTLKLEEMLDAGHTQDISGATQTETQAIIEKDLGMSYDVWHNTIMYAQMDDKRFLNATDAERKALLRSVFEFDSLSIGLKKARTELKLAKDSMAEKELDAVKLEASVQANQHFIVSAKENIQRLKAEKGKVKKGTDKQGKAINAEIDKLEKVEKKIDEKHIVCDARLKNLAEKKEEVLVLRSANALLRAKLKTDDEHIQEILDALSADECPVCGTSTSDLGNTIAGHEKAKAEIEKQQSLAHKESNAIELKKREIDHDINASNEQMMKLSESRMDSGDEIQKRQRELNEIKIKQNSVKLIEDQLKHYQKAKKDNEETVHLLRVKIDRIENEKCLLKEKIEKYDFWVYGFGLQGLQNEIFNQLTDQLAYWANDFLNTLTDGSMSVSFDTTTELVKGTAKDKFAIHWEVEGYPDVILSGSQRKKISIAIDLALAEMVRGRNKFNMLILDELFDSLDQTSKMRVIDLLEELKDRYQSIYVITHDSTLGGSFDNAWQVRRKAGKAKVIS